MKSIITATLLVGTVFGGAALAQTPPAQPPTTPPALVPPSPVTGPPTSAVPTADTSRVVAASELEQGANSFTEGQARGRFEDAGFTSIQNLMKDDAGFWRGRGMRNGTAVDLAMDFRGRIAMGPEVASLRVPPASTRSDAAPASALPRSDVMPPRTDTAPPPPSTR